MSIGSKIDFEYEEVLDRKTQGLIRVAWSRRMPAQPLQN